MRPKKVLTVIGAAALLAFIGGILYFSSPAGQYRILRWRIAWAIDGGRRGAVELGFELESFLRVHPRLLAQVERDLLDDGLEAGVRGFLFRHAEPMLSKEISIAVFFEYLHSDESSLVEDAGGTVANKGFWQRLAADEREHILAEVDARLERPFPAYPFGDHDYDLAKWLAEIRDERRGIPRAGGCPEATDESAP
jgi:hypothetical protein